MATRALVYAFLSNGYLFLMMLIDMLILDWLLISRITPALVILSGTIREDYGDFSHHCRGHRRAALVLILVLLLVAALIRYL